LDNRKQGVAEGLDQPREAGKAIQSLKNLAVMKSALTMQQLSQAGRESIVINAINAAKTLEQSYMADKQQGNAIFVRALRDEIDNFRRGAPINASFPESDNVSELGDLLQGKLGKVDFQQGVAEGLENYKGIQLSLEIQKDDEFVDDDDTDNQTIFVQATASGRELGQVVFAIDYDDKGMILVPQDLEVDERFRGQGIAATMYDYVKSKGYRIHRSYDQTPAGAGFWDKHKPGKDIWEQGMAEGRSVKRAAIREILARNS
jgi:GNAT superfamily N-acetyltransferase